MQSQVIKHGAEFLKRGPACQYECVIRLTIKSIETLWTFWYLLGQWRPLFSPLLTGMTTPPAPPKSVDISYLDQRWLGKAPHACDRDAQRPRVRAPIQVLLLQPLDKRWSACIAILIGTWMPVACWRRPLKNTASNNMKKVVTTCLCESDRVSWRNASYIVGCSRWHRLLIMRWSSINYNNNKDSKPDPLYKGLWIKK